MLGSSVCSIKVSNLSVLFKDGFIFKDENDKVLFLGLDLDLIVTFLLLANFGVILDVCLIDSVSSGIICSDFKENVLGCLDL